MKDVMLELKLDVLYILFYFFGDSVTSNMENGAEMSSL